MTTNCPIKHDPLWFDPECSRPTFCIESVSHFPSIGNCDVYISLDLRVRDGFSWQGCAFQGADSKLEEQIKHHLKVDLPEFESIIGLIPAADTKLFQIRGAVPALKQADLYRLLKGLLAEIVHGCHIEIDGLSNGICLSFRPYFSNQSFAMNCTHSMFTECDNVISLQERLRH